MTRRGWGVVALVLCLGSPAWADRSELAYTTIQKGATGNGPSSADTALWTPPTDFKFLLQGCALSSTTGNNTIELEVSDVDVIPPVRFETNGIFVIESGGAVIYESAEDAVLRYTVTGGGTWHIRCWGYEALVGD